MCCNNILSFRPQIAVRDQPCSQLKVSSSSSAFSVPNLPSTQELWLSLTRKLPKTKKTAQHNSLALCLKSVENLKGLNLSSHPGLFQTIHIPTAHPPQPIPSPYPSTTVLLKSFKRMFLWLPSRLRVVGPITFSGERTRTLSSSVYIGLWRNFSFHINAYYLSLSVFRWLKFIFAMSVF